ncbi:hypothetical protein BHE74_00015359 [Ensete ventricosum]|nr:hypothetical protein GW17_00006534 [Ensete ventricosum]RWW76561.1 hypothetical protein BHE74_00015359 [Ensete ventricosum]RZR91150.1 hypothetical protein BHM03_00019223 [Ensete ventricosum]
MVLVLRSGSAPLKGTESVTCLSRIRPVVEVKFVVAKQRREERQWRRPSPAFLSRVLCFCLVAFFSPRSGEICLVL